MTSEWDPIAELERRTEEALLGEGQERIDKQHQAGKMTARERLAEPGRLSAPCSTTSKTHRSDVGRPAS